LNYVVIVSDVGETVPLFTATLCAEDIERLKDFPVREYILTPHDQQALYLGLFDIIAAYCYDHRTTEGDSTSESAWTINKLSATLSWFEVINFSVTTIHIYFVIESVHEPLGMLLYLLVGCGW
jgi:hypothetical protein